MPSTCSLWSGAGEPSSSASCQASPEALSLSATDADWAVVRDNAARRGLSISRYAVALVLGGGWEARDGPALALDAREQHEMLQTVRAFRAWMGDAAEASSLIRDMQVRVALLFDAWAVGMVRDGRREELRALLATRVEPPIAVLLSECFNPCRYLHESP